MRKSGKTRSGLMLALVGSLSACGGGSGDQASGGEGSKLAPEVWTKCADEYQVCTFSGTREVRYGLNGTWVTRTATGSIECSNEVFGDPLPGADKICEYVTITSSPAPAPGPAPAPAPAPTPAPSWVKCADEYGTCTVPGTTEVRYGLNGTWATRTVTGSVECSNEVFGDPLPGANKICEYATTTPSPSPSPAPAPTPVPAPGPAPSWIKCADEYGTCTVPGTTEVRYGLNGTWATRTVTGSVECSNEVFGDPLPGANKICEYATTTPSPAPAPTPAVPAPVPGATLTMSCVDGGGWHCSGDAILRTENGVILTASGVQAYGKSTNDLASPIADPTAAYGLAPASGGFAEVRVAKGADGTISSPALLLRNLGISWDGKVERPIIVETFRTTQGRVTIDSNGLISFGALPHRSNLGFYDFATKGPAGTQLNYANNSYFPRSEPSRCGFSPCPTTETAGLQYHAGDWLSGGVLPHSASVSRLHGDGDVHAGDGPPDANGNPTILPGGNGPGVPFPGSKGYRLFNNWSYQYANLGAWISQDTVEIVEWTAGAGIDEHNQSRSGMVAFGNVTTPAQVPSAGSASYAVQVYGWYAPNGTAEASFYRGTGQVTVNFATRQATIAIQNTRTDNEAQTPVPATMNATVMMGAAGSNVANYLTGGVNNGTLAGGIGARYFGPVAAGGSGTGPAEIGGAFTLSGSGGATTVGGFVGRKQ